MFKDLFYKKDLFLVSMFFFILILDIVELLTTGLITTSSSVIIVFTVVSLLLIFSSKKIVSNNIKSLDQKSKIRLQKMWDRLMVYSTLFVSSIFFHIVDLDLLKTIGSFITITSYFMLISQTMSINEFTLNNMRVGNES